MLFLQRPLRAVFDLIESWLDKPFGPDWNPMYHLGALGFFYFWVVAVSGIYVYIFFDTGISEAYDSVEYMTHDQWYLAGVMRSLHRYASDGMVAMMMLHMVREFSLDRHRGSRWFTWFTGVPILWLVVICGITGYWLVWDSLAQYVATATTEWLDWLPIFGESVARNFLSPELLDDRFFTLMVFLHIAVPLILLLVLWIHLQRVSKPEIFPARGLAVGSFGMLLALSLAWPALSQGPADLGKVPAAIGLDWFYLIAYPVVEIWGAGPAWALAFGGSTFICILPWLPRLQHKSIAQVDLANCNGCTRCQVDCPFAAITMNPRSDGRPFEREAVVDPELCTGCGLCAGACPTSTPFRRASALVPGIDLVDQPLRDLRQQIQDATDNLSGERRVLMLGCAHGMRFGHPAIDGVAAVQLPCVGALPPSFIDYVLSRNLADGVLLAGCNGGECYSRFGIRWTEERLAGERDPHLRSRVPRDRIGQLWTGARSAKQLGKELRAFQARLPERPAKTEKSKAQPEASPETPAEETV
ncbi:MAG: 4Fe-4S binding protein [Rhodospirillaceae bacterium]|nr:4Fe-4S binding protein [Rhodospirillaceae bacterium]MBT3494582.1 4Fe-4S binding protein [Rhodospirillaceae bacterium]MBT3782639.1 4Fe-4S binding protein [Rhodospirillaceae bacterium]MBT3974888.1 4Fe-4S binding protein [Rhodospirillaceae bacterium]MBT4171418.1 4Fe-4S binding protein [Rhodospirillaceae bacterium]